MQVHNKRPGTQTALQAYGISWFTPATALMKQMRTARSPNGTQQRKMSPPTPDELGKIFRCAPKSGAIIGKHQLREKSTEVIKKCISLRYGTGDWNHTISVIASFSGRQRKLSAQTPRCCRSRLATPLLSVTFCPRDRNPALQPRWIPYPQASNAISLRPQAPLAPAADSRQARRLSSRGHPA